MKKLVLYFVCLPWDLLAWLAIVVLWACWGTGLRWRYGVLSFEWKPESWPVRTWYKGWAGTTLGHAILFAPGQREEDRISLTKRHELIHVEQYEVAMTVGFVIAAATEITIASAGHWLAGAILGGLLWFLAGSSHVAAAALVAWLRGENAYAGAEHEESAYAQVAQYIAQQKGLK